MPPVNKKHEEQKSKIMDIAIELFQFNAMSTKVVEKSVNLKMFQILVSFFPPF